MALPRTIGRISNQTNYYHFGRLRRNCLPQTKRRLERILKRAHYRRLSMTKKNSSIVECLLETADDMYRTGIMDKATHDQITLRHLGPQALRTAEPISGEEIRTLRERAHLSQAVFARYLNQIGRA